MDIINDKAVPLTKQLMNDYEKIPCFYRRNACPTRRSFFHTVLSPSGEEEMTAFTVLKPSLKSQHLKTHQVI